MRHDSLKHKVRFTGSICREEIFCTVNSLNDVIYSSPLKLNKPLKKF